MQKKTDIKRDFYVFFKNDFKELREVKLLGKATLHVVFHSFNNTNKIWGLKSTGLTGRNSKITASRLAAACTWMT